jgi:hypothetical protein
MLTEAAKYGMIAEAWTMDYDCCGDADAAAEAPPRLTSPNLISSGGEYNPPEKRKEAISWKMHFPGVASVVKVIWYRFRISAAKELP